LLKYAFEDTAIPVSKKKDTAIDMVRSTLEECDVVAILGCHVSISNWNGSIY
jgi:hypothetical protein